MSDETKFGLCPLDVAYAACREIARREAKNFYYAFVALPKPRRDAICAIYAFMRQADDLADDERFTREQRRKNLDAWMLDWHGVCKSGGSSNPVFMAVSDAVNRFQIPLTLLDELAAGVTMDLDSADDSREPDTYNTFADLYHYCYLVASVVGLVTIRIFGYSGQRAEKLAEETGIAFQLTNILRDVAEDAARNRVYLPLEDLKTYGVTVDTLVGHVACAPPNEHERALFAEIAQRAERFYRSADELLPLIDRESRPALRVLVSIYHELLKRIERANYDVYSQRASVPTAQKLTILAGGMARMGLMRLLPLGHK
jgi:phytoene synthase